MERDLAFERKSVEQSLRALFGMQAALKKEVALNRKAGDYYNSGNGCGYQFSKAYTEVNLNYLRSIRKMIRNLEYKDPLEYRNNCRGKRCCEFLMNSTEGYDTYTFHPETYWIDEFLQSIREGRRPKRKDAYFRLEGAFYTKKDFILKDNKAYNKNEFAINDNGDLVELSKCLKLHSYYNGDHYQSHPCFESTNWMMSEGDDKFECMNRPSIGTYPVKIAFFENHENVGYYGRFIDPNFFYTMFRFGNKRYFYRDTSTTSSAPFYLTVEMLKEIEFAPTKEHERIWKSLYEKSMWYKKQNNRSTIPRIDVTSAGACAKIEYDNSVVKSSAIKDKVIRAILDENRAHSLSIGSALKRLHALKELYQTEAKYDTKRN